MSHDVIWAVRWSDLMLSDDLIRHTYVNETPLPGGAAPRVGSGSGRGSRAWCVTWPSGSRRIPHTDRPQLHTCGGPPTCSIGTARRRMIGRPASRRHGVYTHQPDNRKKKKKRERGTTSVGAGSNIIRETTHQPGNRGRKKKKRGRERSTSVGRLQTPSLRQKGTERTHIRIRRTV